MVNPGQDCQFWNGILDVAALLGAGTADVDRCKQLAFESSDVRRLVPVAGVLPC